jgi:hypothetical protein
MRQAFADRKAEKEKIKMLTWKIKKGSFPPQFH